MQGNPRNFALFVTMESALGFLAVLIAWWTGISLTDRLDVSGANLARGLVACLPMLAAFWVASFSQWRPLVELRLQVERLVKEIFGQNSWPELAVISLTAGLGEELLFRGALQGWISSYTGATVSVAIVSLLFGVAHAMSVTYFVAATAIGLFLGWLTEAYDDLVAPIVAHAVYDFVAILVIRRRAMKSQQTG